MSITIKNEEQIEGIRKACQLAIDAIDYAEQFVKPGISTETIDAEIEGYVRKYGGVPATLGYHGYPKSSCTSLNEVICHGIPKSTDVLKEGDIIKIDVATIVDGYFGDTCKTFPVGSVSEEAQRLMVVSKDCLDIGISRVRPNQKFGEIGKAITEYAESRGYSVVFQFAGHGTGLSLHEEPQISHDNRRYDERIMEPGMIFTIEPMICTKGPDAVVLNDGWTAVTADGGLSAQFEHTILVTEDGSEVLTR